MNGHVARGQRADESADTRNYRLMELFDTALDMTRVEQDEFLLRVRAECRELGERLSALLAGDRAPLDYRLRAARAACRSGPDAGQVRSNESHLDEISYASSTNLDTEVSPCTQLLPAALRTFSGETPSFPLARPARAIGTASGHPRAGMMVHRYQLIRELGRGGMGAVFLARDTRLGRLAAIKFLHLARPELVQRFIAEARATALCNHENIVIIYDADEYQGMPYMALEYLEGRTLRQLMQEHAASAAADGRPGMRSALSAERALGIAIPMLHALQRAHEMGIVHRDLKPENVMVTDTGAVKVLDFGIAKVLDGDSPGQTVNARRESGDDRESTDGSSASPLSSCGDLSASAIAFGHTDVNPPMTHPGALIGTLPYMSPEQLRSQTVDERTDVWAVGIILFEMLTGRHPLAPISRSRLCDVLDTCKPMPRLSEERPDLGPLARIVDGCLVKSRAGRIATVSELLDELSAQRGRRSQAVVGADQSPFNGLAAFQESDASRFFGRSEDIVAVVARVRSFPMVAVMGASGVGKSSLVRAGVIPALKSAGERWDARLIRPGRTPLASLAGLLTQLDQKSAYDSTHTSGDVRDLGGLLLDEVSPDSSTDSVGTALEDRLQREPGYLGSRLRLFAQRTSRRMLLFVDQFEELFTLDVEPAERAAFLACLIGVADDASSPLRIIVAMRSDFIERLADARDFMAIATRGLMLLPPIGRPGLREALVKPVEAAGYRFENDSVIESMLDALEDSHGALPLLQFTADHLWQTRDREHSLLTENSYLAMGGIAGALARHANAVLASMSAQGVSLTRRIFERLVTPERTRAIISVEDLCELASGADDIGADDIENVLRQLADARLVVIDTSAEEGGGLVEVVHESLIASWPTLNRWLDENQEDAAFIGRLAAAATQWVKSGEAQGMLWRGDTEAEARRWSARYTGPLADRERRFLAAVFALADRAHRRARVVVIAIIASLSLMFMAAVVGLLSIRAAERESKHQADNARHQLRAFQREQIAKKQAEEDRAAALTEVRAGREELRTALNKEKASRTRTETERQRAQQALQKARRAETRARHAQQRAERAAQAEARANQELQRRIDRVEQKTGRINDILH